MGRIAKVLSFLRLTRRDAKVSDVKLDTGGGANITAEHFSSPGDDSFPLTTDYAITVDIPRSGGGVVVGYIDPINTSVALEGEKRIYARDPANGSIKVALRLKNDGAVTFSNANGSMDLAVDGTFNINGVTIDKDGKLTANIVDATTSLLAAGDEVVEHDHIIKSGSSAPGPTEKLGGP
ncbi:MAG: hypothetical protein JRJ62_00120 [Deltaproteobacteria bacterium]|nr:hypothetical protein [Deltaproteobacteria bacterium]